MYNEGIDKLGFGGITMLIDFNQKEEIAVPGMNKGTGTMTAKMYMDEWMNKEK